MASNRTIVMGKSAIPGSIVAMALSYAINHSIFFAIMHMFCGWFYVLYWLFTYTDICNWINSWVVY